MLQLCCCFCVVVLLLTISRAGLQTGIGVVLSLLVLDTKKKGSASSRWLSTRESRRLSLKGPRGFVSLQQILKVDDNIGTKMFAFEANFCLLLLSLEAFDKARLV